MGKVFFDVGASLDGFIARTNSGANNPLGDGGIKNHDWVFKQKSCLEHIKREGGESGTVDDNIIKDIFNRIGSNIIRKKMFIEG